MHDPRTIAVALSGLGGYGEHYLRMLLDSPAGEAVRLVAGIEPQPERCARLKDLQARGIPVFPSFDAWQQSGAPAELVIVSAPIHLHAPQTCAALAAGCHVLCEKPVAATVQEVRRMIAAREAARRVVAVGYQWSFYHAIRALKRDLLDGVYGRPLRFRTLVLWPRTHAYYRRSSWAGALRSPQGDWVLDSPVNNACAHYLHNMLYLLGPAEDRSAPPVSVTAELARANAITNYDTAALRARTAAGAELLFVTSHAVDQACGPAFELECEAGSVRLSGGSQTIEGLPRGGARREYPLTQDQELLKLTVTLEALRSGAPVPCGLETAMAQTLVMDGAHDSAPRIVEFAAADTRTLEQPNNDTLTCVPGLLEQLKACYDAWCLPSEAGARWAVPGRTVDLCEYRAFPSGSA
jgi:predicted dehydrogenase